jgi:uncharacterized membrane protein YeaQ/YmgE (transglycosylase-associated protein family)
MRTDVQQGILLSIVVGIIGAMVGGVLISPLVGAGAIDQNDFSIAALVVSFIGAVIVLAMGSRPVSHRDVSGSAKLLHPPQRQM